MQSAKKKTKIVLKLSDKINALNENLHSNKVIVTTNSCLSSVIMNNIPLSNDLLKMEMIKNRYSVASHVNHYSIQRKSLKLERSINEFGRIF